MKLLFDQNLSFKLCRSIADVFPGSDQVGRLGPPPKVIWLRAGNQPTLAISTLLRRHAELIAAFGSDGDAACLEIY